MSDSRKPEIERIKPPKGLDSSSEKPDKETELALSQLDIDQKIELKRLEVEYQRVKLARKQKELDNFQQDVDKREEYSNKLFRLISAWIFFVAVVVVIQGLFGNTCLPHWFSLNDSVLIALITTTTASIIGLFVIVAKYFFYRPDSSDEENKNE